MPAVGGEAISVGVMWLDGWPGRQLHLAPIFVGDFCLASREMWDRPVLEKQKNGFDKSIFDLALYVLTRASFQIGLNPLLAKSPF